MTKPRIISVSFSSRPSWRWACFSGVSCGFGSTPREAYHMWWNVVMRINLLERSRTR